MSAEDDGKLTYIAVHTKGYDTTADLVILAAPVSQGDDLRVFAEQVCPVGGKYAPASPQRVYGLASKGPDYLYGGRRVASQGYGPFDGRTAAARIHACAEATVEDFSASNEEITARLDGDR